MAAERLPAIAADGALTNAAVDHAGDDAGHATSSSSRCGPTPSRSSTAASSSSARWPTPTRTCSSARPRCRRTACRARAEARATPRRSPARARPRSSSIVIPEEAVRASERGFIVFVRSPRRRTGRSSSGQGRPASTGWRGARPGAGPAHPAARWRCCRGWRWTTIIVAHGRRDAGRTARRSRSRTSRRRSAEGGASDTPASGVASASLVTCSCTASLTRPVARTSSG